MDGCVKCRKMFKKTSGVVAPLSNSGNIEKVWHLLLQNCHLLLHLIIDELDTCKDTYGKGKRKVCSCFVLHAGTAEWEEDRVAARQDLIEMMDSDPDYFKRIVTGDESWCFAYEPVTKRQSSVWVGENSPQPQKL
jgi:hypothetical protein